MNSKCETTDREKEIFNEALELASPDARAAYLKGACGDDQELRLRIEALLKAYYSAGGFIPTKEYTVMPATPLSEGPGTRIGRYKLLQQIGDGGMGVVYMAEQEEPVRRRVALKIIKLGMDTRQVVARFEAERQALALIDHPNIARILDGGATETGRPYFVMELVQGVPITDFCDKAKLSTEDRLKLFMQVCQAIQHAHQKGIIHRDIKPSNVLVTLHDGEPVPKVIDFGIAKATNQKLTEKTLFTNFATMIGTPAYMSPEQAEMSGLDVDTRTDIYALGVLLYALLTGTTPFPEKRLCSLGYGEMQRIIVEEEPERPSARLSTMANEQRLIVARNCGDEHGSLAKLLRGDLDWVVMKCLEKDRQRRYETASGLAMDIQRHLRQEPVSAAAPSTWYVLGKYARRHRAGLAAAAAIALVLIAGATISAWQAVRATRAEKRALAERGQAVFARDRAQSAEIEAKQDRQKAIEEQKRADIESNRANLLLYLTHFGMAKRAWEEGDIAKVDELLNLELPQPGRPDLRSFEWFYLHRLCHGDLETLKGHTDWVDGVAFSPDGKRLASASGDRTVKVWNVATGQERLTLRGHTNHVTGLAFSQDGRRLASASYDHTVKVWDTTSGQELLTLNGHTNRVWSVAFSPDGNRLASADRTVRVWDGTSGRETLTLEGHGSLVYSVAFSPDGKRMVSGGEDRMVKVWDATSGEELLTLIGHTNEVWGVAFSPDGKWVASASMDRTVKVWDATSGQERFTLEGHTGEVNKVAFSPDGSRLASSSYDRTVKVWDTATGQETLTLRGHTHWVNGVAFSPDGSRLVSASQDRTLKLWDVVTGQMPLRLIAHSNWIHGVTFSPDGKRLASAGGARDKKVKVWDASSGDVLLTLEGHRADVKSVAFSPDGKLLASAGLDRMVKVWDATTGIETLTLRGNTYPVFSVAFSPDGKRLALAGGDPGMRRNASMVEEQVRDAAQEIKVWDAATGVDLLTLNGHTNVVLSVKFSPDGKQLATASWDGTVKVWDAMTGREVLTLKGHTGGVTSVAYSPDGKSLASASVDQTVKVWDATSGRETFTLKGHTNRVMSVVFSPDGRRLASAGADGKVKVWDTMTGQEILALSGHRDWVSGVAFSPDGKRLAWGTGLIALGKMVNGVWVWDDAAPSGEVELWDARPRSEAGNP